MIKEHGWPGISLVGEQASHATWLILQHADTERQKRYLAVLKLAVSKGDAYASDLAMREDRVLTNDGKKQLYSTQIISGDDGKPKLYPIKDPANLDTRRKAVGLSPIEEYLKLAESELGMSVDRSPLLE